MARTHSILPALLLATFTALAMTYIITAFVAPRGVSPPMTRSSLRGQVAMHARGGDKEPLVEDPASSHSGSRPRTLLPRARKALRGLLNACTTMARAHSILPALLLAAFAALAMTHLVAAFVAPRGVSPPMTRSSLRGQVAMQARGGDKEPLVEDPAAYVVGITVLFALSVFV
eukprot:CAMPEP_0179102400 /NCGR_PEP_ID=MMETSP0796-20121207/47393_1 /TAXON_ID=73915 /ORGANISM="Pyrodinium bahamense, Strain pbaha01" /LENGTH=172 /DNA_ID=CAMNT_0020800275 /DNA_START=73 /DNA_END=588 /DNA_ORIENTATION=-